MVRVYKKESFLGANFLFGNVNVTAGSLNA